MDDQRFFENTFADYSSEAGVKVNRSHIKSLIKVLVAQITRNTQKVGSSGDLYVGDAGIAYMFLRLWQANVLVSKTSAIENAHKYIARAKANAKPAPNESCAFLCGNAGIYAVSAVISHMARKDFEVKKDLQLFGNGFEICKPLNFNQNGSDELLVGRAGFLSGVYWLNRAIKPSPFDDELILEICQSMVDSGRQYGKEKRSTFPLMYQYHGTEYLGAAHGLSSILQMLMESPWFQRDEYGGYDLTQVPPDVLADIMNSIDSFVASQDDEGNFPSNITDVDNPQPNILVHWCHGAPGVLYLLIKAYLVFDNEKYLDACTKAADVIWKKGLLKKGPGICHGIAGNGYAFLILYRLTRNDLYLYRCVKFVEFLTKRPFMQEALIPEHPYSLYEGTAGTVCYLLDLLSPESASFPFMEVF